LNSGQLFLADARTGKTFRAGTVGASTGVGTMVLVGTAGWRDRVISSLRR
jgi:hypothetical protein